MPQETKHRSAVEARFAEVFTHLGLLSAYARRRGARDPDAIAAEAMAIAWRRLADVPHDDPRPWLIATARNLVLAERRRHGGPPNDLEGLELAAAPELQATTLELDPQLEAALATLSPTDREAVLLVAWEDLTPSAAAASLGISPAAFRVRLHRARRRLLYELGTARTTSNPRTANPAWSSYEHRSATRTRPRSQSQPGRDDRRRRAVRPKRAVRPDHRRPRRCTPHHGAEARPPAAYGHARAGPDRSRRRSERGWRDRRRRPTAIAYQPEGAVRG